MLTRTWPRTTILSLRTTKAKDNIPACWYRKMDDSSVVWNSVRPVDSVRVAVAHRLNSSLFYLYSITWACNCICVILYMYICCSWLCICNVLIFLISNCIPLSSSPCVTVIRLGCLKSSVAYMSLNCVRVSPIIGHERRFACLDWLPPVLFCRFVAFLL